MLVNLPPAAIARVRFNPINQTLAIMYGDHGQAKPIARGVYWAHPYLNDWDKPLLEDAKGFDGPLGDGPPDAPIGSDSAEAWNAYFAAMRELPPSYGVCDNWEQIVEKWPLIENSPVPLVIRLREIRKEDQGPNGGWRWHKNGEYIGTQDPQCEYLYDEEGIDQVILFEINTIKSEILETYKELYK